RRLPANNQPCVADSTSVRQQGDSAGLWKALRVQGFSIGLEGMPVCAVPCVAVIPSNLFSGCKIPKGGQWCALVEEERIRSPDGAMDRPQRLPAVVSERVERAGFG